MLVQAALGPGLLYHAHQFLLCDAVVPSAAKDLGHQAFPLGKQEIQRSQDYHEDLEQGDGKHGKALRIFLCQALGGDLAKDEDHDGQYRSGYRGAALFIKQLDKQYRADGGRYVVDNIVADEDSRQQLVVLL